MPHGLTFGLISHVKMLYNTVNGMWYDHCYKTLWWSMKLAPCYDCYGYTMMVYKIISLLWMCYGNYEIS